MGTLKNQAFIFEKQLNLIFSVIVPAGEYQEYNY